MGATRVGWLLLVGLVCGCTKPPPSNPPLRGAAQPAKVETTVRALVAEQFGVPAADVAMDRPLSDPPLRADELDLVELVMELEERFDIAISDETLEKRADPTHKPDPTRVTPADLVAIVRNAKRPSARTAK